MTLSHRVLSARANEGGFLLNRLLDSIAQNKSSGPVIVILEDSFATMIQCSPCYVMLKFCLCCACLFMGKGGQSEELLTDFVKRPE